MLMRTRSGSIHHNIFAAFIDRVFLEGTWWWTANILAAQIVLTIMASAPNLFCIRPILDDAIQVGANRRERL
jgi:hypothetical protein